MTPFAFGLTLVASYGALNDTQVLDDFAALKGPMVKRCTYLFNGGSTYIYLEDGKGKKFRVSFQPKETGRESNDTVFLTAEQDGSDRRIRVKRSSLKVIREVVGMAYSNPHSEWETYDGKSRKDLVEFRRKVVENFLLRTDRMLREQ